MAAPAANLVTQKLGRPTPNPRVSNIEEARLRNRAWRLRNLYWIRDKNGQRVLFKPTKQQQKLLEQGLSRKMVVLKGRQIHMTTLFCILWLDKCLFSKDIKVGIVAHTKEDAAKIFREKIAFAFDNLPDDLKAASAPKKRTEHELILPNGSEISVGVSFRSGMINILHITEYGYICSYFPNRAEEIQTGAMQAVPKDGIIAIESTAKGSYGHFKELVDEGQKRARSGGQYDWRLSFFPWYQHEEYTLDDPKFAFTEFEQSYLDNLSNTVVLTHGQRVWWARKQRDLGGKVFSEYPSTIEEAFKQSAEGAYYGAQMLKAWQDGRIHKVPINPGVAHIETWWDIGHRDSTAIWFVQRIGHRILVLDYYENSGYGLEHYAKILGEKREKYNWIYGRHIGPHDLNQHEFTTGQTRAERARLFGIVFTIAPSIGVDEGIDTVRTGLANCEFDEGRCALGIKALEHYRHEWDPRRGVWKDSPLHDWSSHCADAFRYGMITGGQETYRAATRVMKSIPVTVRRFA